jgi:hypothetical protein
MNVPSAENACCSFTAIPNSKIFDFLNTDHPSLRLEDEIPPALFNEILNFLREEVPSRVPVGVASPTRPAKTTVAQIYASATQANPLCQDGKGGKPVLSYPESNQMPINYLLNGSGRIYDHRQQLRYVGELYNGTYHGKGTFFFDDTFLEGEFYLGNPRGICTQGYCRVVNGKVNVETHQGNFVDGVRWGLFNIYMNGVLVQQRYYHNGFEIHKTQ